MSPREMKLNEWKNRKYLGEFKAYLKKKGLSKNVIENFVTDANLYVNSVMLYKLKKTAIQGAEPMNAESFFGSIYIYECQCFDTSELESVIKHVRTFYSFLTKMGVLPYSYYKEFVEQIEDSTEYWKKQVEFFIDGLGF